MPYFVLVGLDHKDKVDLRRRLRPAHQAHFFAPQPDCRGVSGGPLLDDAGEKMIGSLLVFEAADRAAVDRFVENDPYTQNGLFQRLEIWPWRWGLGRPDAPV